MTKYSVWLIDSEPPTENGRQKLKSRLVHALGLPQESIDKVFSTLPRSLKKDLAEEDAKQYVRVLEKLGASAEMRVEEDLSFDEESSPDAPKPTVTPDPFEEEVPAESSSSNAHSAEDYSLEDLENMLTSALDDPEPMSEADRAVNEKTQVSASSDSSSSEIEFSLKFDEPEESTEEEETTIKEAQPPNLDDFTSKPANEKVSIITFTDDDSTEARTVPPPEEIPIESVSPPPPPPDSTIVSKAFAKPSSESQTKVKVEPQNSEPQLERTETKENTQQESSNGLRKLLNKYDSLLVRGGLILIAIGIIVLIIKPEFLLGPSSESSSYNKPSKEEILSLLEKHKQAVALRKRQKELAAKAKPLIRYWKGSFSKSPVQAQMTAITENDRISTFELNVKSDKPPEITAEELVEGVSRPWLKSLFCDKFEDAKAETDSKQNSQTLVGTAKAYISDGGIQGRTVAKVTLEVSQSNPKAKILRGVWRVSSGGISKDEEKTFFIKKVTKRRFSLHLMGEFNLEPAPELRPKKKKVHKQSKKKKK